MALQSAESAQALERLGVSHDAPHGAHGAPADSLSLGILARSALGAALRHGVNARNLAREGIFRGALGRYDGTPTLPLARFHG